MHHGMRDFDSGREAVEEHAPRFSLEHRQQLTSHPEVRCLHVHGCRQLSLQTLGKRAQLRHVATADEERCRAKQLLLQALIGKHGLGVCNQQRRLALAARRPLAARRHSDPRHRAELAQPGLVGAVDAG